MTTTVNNMRAPLNSKQAFRYLWFNWRIIGMNAPQRFRLPYNIYAVVANIFFTIGLPLSLLINLHYIAGLEQLVSSLSLTTSVWLASLKQFLIYLNLDKLKRANYYLDRLDVRCNEHEQERQHVLWAMRVCHLFYISYMIHYNLIGGGFALVGFSTRQLVYNGWFPQFFEQPEKNLLATLIYQNTAVLSLFVWQNVNNDIYPPCYMAMLIGQLRALSLRMARIGRSVECSEEEIMRELLECIQDHKNVLGYFGCIRAIISRTMSVQFLVTAAVVCLTAINIIAFNGDILKTLFNSIFLFGLLIEVFPLCWFGNAVQQESNHLTTALYSCGWYEQNIKFRKNLIIFMQRTQKANIIMAGDLMPVTLLTFSAIIKFTFSMFTILRRLNI